MVFFSAMAVLLLIIVLVGACCHAFEPVCVLKVPVDRFAQPFFKGDTGLPAELLINLTGINGIPPVMTRTVFYICDEFFAGAAGSSQFLIYELAKQFYKVNVFPFIKPANVIRL